jgi:hypothetical protein
MTAAGDNRCPVCRAGLWAPDSETIGERSCPRCGAELWWFVGSGGPVFLVRPSGQSARRCLAALAARRHGLPADDMEELLKGCDSLDLVEVVTTIEEELKVDRG